MKIPSSRILNVAGVFLAGLLVATLAGCSSAASAAVNPDYLVLANVNDIDCSAAGDHTTVANELQVAADFVADASRSEERDILKLNPDLDSLEPLEVALDEKITACGGPTIETASDSDSEPMSDELKALLDASKAPTIDCVQIITDTGGPVVNGTYALLLKALNGVVGTPGETDPRLWSDALSTALAGSTPQEMYVWLQRAICEEPFIGVSLQHLFAHLEVKGISVLSLQSTDWLESANVDDSEIAELVATYTPLTIWTFENPDEDIPDDVYDAQLEANREYQAMASKLVYLMRSFQLGTVMNVNSTHYYRLVVGGLTADGLPEVEVQGTPPDTRPSLVFYLTEKTACVPIAALAFNTGDKRPMLVDIPASCETFNPPCTSNCAPPCTTDCSPVCTSNCNPPCTTNCPKDWSLNPAKPDGVGVAGNDEYKEPPAAAEEPAPVVADGTTQTSESGATGATGNGSNNDGHTAGTGTTTGGGTGSVNGTTGDNTGDTGNPFGH